MEKESPYLKKPLYIYDLPPELIESLILHSAIATSQQHEYQPQPDTPRNDQQDGAATSTACALCKATFRDVSDQRQQVRSDFHRYNLKLSLKSLPPIDEATFIKRIGELDESISGSDTSDSESEQESNETDSTLSALLKRQARIAGKEDEDTARELKKRGPGNAPMYWLTSPRLPNGMGVGIYRAVLSNDEQQTAQTHLTDILKKKQVQPVHAKQSGQKAGNAPSNDPHFFLCMIGGGHFAAAIIGLAPETRKGPGGIEQRHAIVKAHKTFHRYTTRRKQGGSQSANDNAKGNAHSVGSSIRRANEAALVLDIRNLLTEWKEMIDSAELIFVRATGSQNRNTLFGQYDGQVLTSKDKRLRGFPFSTRRATQNELIRAFQELTRAKVEKLVVEEPEKKVDATSKPQQKTKPPVIKLTPEEESATLHSTQLQALIKRSKAPGVLLYLKKHDLSANFKFHPPNTGTNHHAPTPLHLAASQNASAVITALLTRSDADPTLKNEDGKVAYDIAGDGRTHDAFRVARHILGESAFNWSSAHVPSALSPEEAELRANKENADAGAAEEERRKAELDRIRREEAATETNRVEKKFGAGKTTSAVPQKTWSEKNEEDQRGLTPEMRQRVERERRARAAEARMKALSGQ